jgi:adenylylsulfate kinase-like enzyme
MAAQQHPFTIAISGCSSAGKSMLAFLLAEIFSDTEASSSGKLALPLISQRFRLALFRAGAEHYYHCSPASLMGKY